MRTCSECGNSSSKFTRGLCRACYSRGWRAKQLAKPAMSKAQAGRAGRAAYQQAIEEGRCACAECEAGRAAARERMAARLEAKRAETQQEFGARMTAIAKQRRAAVLASPEDGFRGSR